jgi:hypothetical protein
MHSCTNARGRRIPRALTNYLLLRRRNPITAVNIVKPSIERSCGHVGAVVRNVTLPGGTAIYVCRDCFANVRAVEVRAIVVDRVRLELAKLFRRLLCPLGLFPGAAIPAPIGEGRATT